MELLGHSPDTLRCHPYVTCACNVCLALQLKACINVPVPLQAGPCLPAEPQHATAPHHSEFTEHSCCNSLQVDVGCGRWACRAVATQSVEHSALNGLEAQELCGALSVLAEAFDSTRLARIRPDTSTPLSKCLRAPILTGLGLGGAGLGGAGLGGGEVGSGSLHSTWQVSPLMLARLRLYMTAPTLTPAAGRGHGQAARIRQ